MTTALFAKRLDAEQAFHDLLHAGFAIDRINVHNRDVGEDPAAVLGGLGLPSTEVQRLQRAVEGGAILLTIQADNRDAEAVDILTRHGGTDTRTQVIPSS
jgi:hypothetical protein